jgi:hypothetical protein
MAGLYDPFSEGGSVGGTVSDDISNLTQPQNSEQAWQTAAAGGGLARRPKLEDYFTQSQLRSGITGKSGAIPGTDIRSPADRGGLGAGGLSLGGKMDSEADWRAFFGPKKSPSQVGGSATPQGGGAAAQPGMNSVMAAVQFQHNLLHSLGVNYTAPKASTLQTLGVTPAVSSPERQGIGGGLVA